MCSSDGYLLCCEPYCGNSTKIPKILNNQGPDVVLGLVDKANISTGSQVFFDNLFTSMPLLDILSNKGINLLSVIYIQMTKQLPATPMIFTMVTMFGARTILRAEFSSVFKNV